MNVKNSKETRRGSAGNFRMRKKNDKKQQYKKNQKFAIKNSARIRGELQNENRKKKTAKNKRNVLQICNGEVKRGKRETKRKTKKI